MPAIEIDLNGTQLTAVEKFRLRLHLFMASNSQARNSNCCQMHSQGATPLTWPMRFEKWFNGAIVLHLFVDFGFIGRNHP